MTDARSALLQARLLSAGRHLTYPPTPDVSRQVGSAVARKDQPRARRLLWAAAAAMTVLVVLLARVPEARALLAGWFRIGVINIVPNPGTVPIHATLAPSTESPAPTRAGEMRELPAAVQGLSGLTSLSDVRESLAFHLQLPQYPQGLGDPDLVYYQNTLDMAVLVWLKPDDPTEVALSLFEFLTANPVVNKIAPRVLAETTVNSSEALWVEGPYPLQVTRGDFEWRRIVEGRALIWESGGITFRLESALTLDEARKIAESVR